MDTTAEVILPRDIDCRGLDERGWNDGRVIDLPAGTRVREVGRGYDPMCIWVYRDLSVLSGPMTGVTVLYRTLVDDWATIVIT